MKNGFIFTLVLCWVLLSHPFIVLSNSCDFCSWCISELKKGKFYIGCMKHYSEVEMQIEHLAQHCDCGFELGSINCIGCEYYDNNVERDMAYTLDAFQEEGHTAQCAWDMVIGGEPCKCGVKNGRSR